MFNKTIVSLLSVLLLSVAGVVLAQPNPSVEIVLNHPTAQQGNTVTADVYIRHATNIGGADVGITVDNACLRIVDREDGSFLPTTSETGGFSVFSELHDHDTRLAAAITDHTKLGNGDGVFFEAQLQVICLRGNAPLKVSFAELSGYKDPAAKHIELVGYSLAKGTVSTVNAVLAIGPAGSVTAVPTATSAPGTEPAQPVSPQSDQSLLVIVILLIAILLIGFLMLFVIKRRRKND